MNYYEILNLSETASGEEIDMQYHNLMIHGTNESVEKAYAVLNDEFSRYIYDNMGYEECEKYLTGTDVIKADYEKQIMQFIKTTESHYYVQVSILELYHGTVKTITVETRDKYNETHKKNYDIKVPAGYEQNVLACYTGEGNQEPGKKPGDLIFLLQITPDENFSVYGLDVYTDLNISVEEVICSDVFTFTNFNNETVIVNLENFNPAQKYLIKNLGMRNEQNMRGDLYINFTVVYPVLNDTVRAELRKILQIPEKDCSKPGVNLVQVAETEDEAEEVKCPVQ